MIELGEQVSLPMAKDYFFEILVARGEDCIEGPVWREPACGNPDEWTDFHEAACCGYASASAIIDGRLFELAATFGH